MLVQKSSPVKMLANVRDCGENDINVQADVSVRFSKASANAKEL